MIMANIRKLNNDYGEAIDYHEAFENFISFTHKLSIKMNLFEIHPNEIDINMMKDEQ